MATRLSAGARREQLLDATKAIVARRGFHAVTIEAVAREAGITRPIVYGHFEDLAGLLEALVERETARALEQLRKVMVANLDEGDPSELLLAALRGYLRVVSADPATWQLVLMPQEGAPAALQEQIGRGRAASIAQLAQAVSPGLVVGEKPPDPELTARMLSAFADEAARLLLADPGTYPIERIMPVARWMLGQLAGPRSGSGAPRG